MHLVGFGGESAVALANQWKENVQATQISRYKLQVSTPNVPKHKLNKSEEMISCHRH